MDVSHTSMCVFYRNRRANCCISAEIEKIQKLSMTMNLHKMLKNQETNTSPSPFTEQEETETKHILSSVSV